jgi:acyl-CoA synthetase (AMP-forming)/AMP-acid ligase II
MSDCLFSFRLEQVFRDIESELAVRWDRHLVQEVEEHIKAHGHCSIDIRSSGSTGKPKLLKHGVTPIWGRIPNDPRELRWFSNYPKGSMGFTQVLLHALKNSHFFEPKLSERVNAISVTPSYFRSLFLFSGPPILDLVQITFGGEHASQSLLSTAAQMYPAAKLTHTYASSELGLVFSSSDGVEGYPLEQMSRRAGITINDSDGELIVKSDNGNNLKTGDMFRIEGSRIKFVARKSDSGNVGGSLVFPNQLSEYLRTLDGVAEARCFLEPSPVTGNVIACQLVLKSQTVDLALNHGLVSKIVERFGRAYRPAKLQIVDNLAFQESGKLV